MSVFFVRSTLNASRVIKRPLATVSSVTGQRIITMLDMIAP
jgi:hypothetical protein